MPLPPLLLDDLDWAQLTDAARLRIPALSAGQWTLHAPVDPGITLIELYAWLLDQRVYMLDRVPEPLFRAVIGLLGESMQPVSAARTVLTLERSGPLTEIPAGTALEIARAATGPVFSTREGIQLLDVARVGVVTPGPGGALVDHSNDLREQRSVTLLPADGGGSEARIILYLRTAPTTGATRRFSLFLDVDAPPKVLPEWNPEAADVPPPAEITWWYSRGTPLPPQPFAAVTVHDGTRGLRRAGVVRFPVPADWAPDGPAVGGLYPYSLFVRTRAATFTFRPTVRRIAPNAAIAEHRRIVREDRRITDWLPLPGLGITLDVSSAPPVPNAVRLHIREADGQWHRWLPVSDFARSGPADRLFRVDRARRRIEFGDGFTGRIPRPDRTVPAPGTNVHIAVTVGGGADGNVGSGLSWTGTDAADVRAVARVSAVGGHDAETLDQARVRIGGLLNRVERAVTLGDHVTLAEATSGVAIARAHAAVGFHPGHPCTVVPGAVTVFVLPWAPRGDDVDPANHVAAPIPDPGALAAVRAHLEHTRMVGTEVWVCPPRYRTVRLAVQVLGDPVDAAAARVRIDQALRRFLDPLEGGDDGTGWPFGGPIRPSVLMREAIRAVRDGEVDLVAIGLDGAAPSESCDEVRLGPHDLPALADVAVTFQPDSRARSGGLR